MTPAELKEYLAVLPASTCQIVLKHDKFEIHLNLAGPMGAGASEVITPRDGGEQQAFDANGNPLPPEVAEAFPHLVKQRQ